MRISDWSSDVCSSDLRIGDDIISRGLAGRQRRMTDRLVDIALYIPQVIGTGGDEVEHAADPDFPRTDRQRSEERRVGKEWVSTCRSRGSPLHSKKQTKRHTTHTKHTYHKNRKH